MSYVIAAPEMMAAAATDLATIGSDLTAAHLAAAAPTVSLIPAAADEVSAAVTHLFSQHAAGYQALAGQAAAFQGQFVQHLHAGAFSYANAEAAIARFLQNLPANVNRIVSNIPTNMQILTADVTWFVSRLPSEIPWFLQTLTADVTRIVSRIPANLQVLGSIIVQNPGLFIGILVELPFLILTAPIWIPAAIILFPFIAVLAVGSGL